MRLVPKLALGLGGLALLWTAGWFAGRALWVAPEADRAVERLREGRLFVAYDSRSIGGFPFGYEVALQGVTVSDESALWRWMAAEARIGGGLGNGGALEIRPSAESRVLVEPASWGGGAGETPMLVEIAATAPLLRLASGPDRPRARLTADRLTAERREGGGPARALRIALDGLDAEAAALDGDGALTLAAARAEAEWTLSPDGVREDRARFAVETVSLEASGAALDAGSPTEFHERGGALTVAFASGRSESSGASTGGPSAAPVEGGAEAASSALRFEAAGGRARLSTESLGLRWRLDGAGAPTPGFAVEAARVAARLDAPLRRAPDPQDWSAGFEVEGAAPGAALWSAFDPAGALPRDPMALKLELGGLARLIADLGAPSAGQSPVDLETLEIRAARLDALGASADAKGALDIAGNAAAPEGRVRLDLAGAAALLDRAEAAGLLPPAAAADLRAMAAEFFAQSAGPDALTAEIDFAPDGAVSVNGKRVR